MNEQSASEFFRNLNRDRHEGIAPITSSRPLQEMQVLSDYAQGLTSSPPDSVTGIVPTNWGSAGGLTGPGLFEQLERNSREFVNPFQPRQQGSQPQQPSSQFQPQQNPQMDHHALNRLQTALLDIHQCLPDLLRQLQPVAGPTWMDLELLRGQMNSMKMEMEEMQLKYEEVLYRLETEQLVAAEDKQ